MSPHKIPHNYPIRAPKYTFSKSKPGNEFSGNEVFKNIEEMFRSSSGTRLWHLKIWWTQEDVKIIWCLNCIQTGSSFNDFFKSSLGRLYISSIFSSGHFFKRSCQMWSKRSSKWTVFQLKLTCQKKNFSGSKYTVRHEL